MSNINFTRKKIIEAVIYHIIEVAEQKIGYITSYELNNIKKTVNKKFKTAKSFKVNSDFWAQNLTDYERLQYIFNSTNIYININFDNYMVKKN